jgi:hypothetical protein
MPNRWVCVGIVGFWLAMMAWFAGREVWNRYGQRPRLQDSLSEAVTDGMVLWDIKHNYVKVGTAETEVLHNPDTGSYRLLQKVKLTKYPLLDWQLAIDVDSRADVKSSGELESLNITIDAGGIGRLHFHGQPRGPALHARISGKVLGAEIEPQELDIAYDARDMFLSSLCPASRMVGLRPGLRWEAPMVDPIETLRDGLGKQALPRRPVVAEVMDEPAIWRTTLCHEVRTQHDNVIVRVWVRKSDNAVLRQEVRWGVAGSETIIEIERHVPKPVAAGRETQDEEAKE